MVSGDRSGEKDEEEVDGRSSSFKLSGEESSEWTPERKLLPVLEVSELLISDPYRDFEMFKLTPLKGRFLATSLVNCLFRFFRSSSFRSRQRRHAQSSSVSKMEVRILGR